MIYETSSVWLKILMRQHIASRFPSNSEANASELLGNFEGMFPRYHMHSIQPLRKSSNFRH